jgi:opacity protein-like surface antigen
MKYLLTSGVVLALAVSAFTANAEPAFTANKPQVAADLGYGIWTGDGDTNGYGLGLGVNGGYTLDMGLYVGARFDYFFGGSQDVPGVASVSYGIWNLMAEAGYDIGIGDSMLVRPQLGLGLATAHGETCITNPLVGGQVCDSSSEGKFAVAPGGTFLYNLGGPFVGATLRYEHVFVDNGNADGLLINATGGMAF